MAAIAMEPEKEAKGFELKITRVFDAPRELVWRAWTDPAMLQQWMGPRGFECVEYMPGTQPGDPWHMVMRGDHPRGGGKILLGQHGRIVEIEPPRLLRYSFAWKKITDVGWPESHYNENTVTVELRELEGRTAMTFTQGPFETEAQCLGHTGGWQSCFDKFAEFMLAEQPRRKPDPKTALTELHVQRFFNAPRELVFEAWTNPEMVPHWFPPQCFTLKVTHWEAHGGGRIDTVMEGMGISHRMLGSFVEVFTPYRLHFKVGVPDANGEMMFENFNSVYFEEVDGGTRVTLDVHVTAYKEMALQFLRGMSMGWGQTLDNLGRFVEAKTAA